MSDINFKSETRLTKAESDKLKDISSWLNNLEWSGHLSAFDGDNIEDAQDCINGIIDNDVGEAKQTKEDK